MANIMSRVIQNAFFRIEVCYGPTEELVGGELEVQWRSYQGKVHSKGGRRRWTVCFMNRMYYQHWALLEVVGEGATKLSLTEKNLKKLRKVHLNE